MCTEKYTEYDKYNELSQSKHICVTITQVKKENITTISSPSYYPLPSLQKIMIVVV